MQDLNASKGAFFTTEGYQDGAEKYAKSMGIDIFVVRELTEEEWGKPGKFIDFYMHFIRKTMYDFEFHNAAIITQSQDSIGKSVGIHLNFQNKDSYHKVLSKHKDKHPSLESYLEKAVAHAREILLKKPFILNNGAECERYFGANIVMPFKEEGEPLLILNDKNVVVIPKLTFKVGFKISQTRFVFDRSKKFDYALVIQDCINDRRYYASKEDNSTARWNPVAKKENDESDEDILQNGSVMSIVIDDYFDPNEMKGLKDVSLDELRKRNQK